MSGNIILFPTRVIITNHMDFLLDFDWILAVFTSFFKKFTHSSENMFILPNWEIKTEQIIFQIGTYKPASFLNYVNYRVKFSKI